MNEDLGLQAQVCALNSVDWCRAVFATHGVSATLADGLFLCRGHVPPYYSNAIVFRPDDVSAQLQMIKALAAQLKRPFSVKDCFARLPLEVLGFRLLFEAQWIWRAPDATENSPVLSLWKRVVSAKELVEWETAWRRFGSPTDESVFLPSLLENPTIAIFVARANDEIIGVCAANRSERVVGLSNFFSAPHANAENLLVSAVQQVSLFTPKLPIVGYERGKSLKTAQRTGFRTTGPLRIWLFDDV